MKREILSLKKKLWQKCCRELFCCCCRFNLLLLWSIYFETKWPGFNFTYNLCAAFTHKSFEQSFFVLSYLVWTFWRKIICENVLIKCWWCWPLWSMSPTFLELARFLQAKTIIFKFKCSQTCVQPPTSGPQICKFVDEDHSFMTSRKFGLFLTTPSPPSSRFSLLRLKYCCPWHLLPLKPWRHLMTTP